MVVVDVVNQAVGLPIKINIFIHIALDHINPPLTSDVVWVKKVEKTFRNREQEVKVIVLFPEENDTVEEKKWLSSITRNPAFNFLKDKEENI